MLSINIEIDDYTSLYITNLVNIDLYTPAVAVALVAGISWRYGRRWYKRRQVTALLGVIAPNAGVQSEADRIDSSRDGYQANNIWHDDITTWRQNNDNQ